MQKLDYLNKSEKHKTETKQATKPKSLVAPDPLVNELKKKYNEHFEQRKLNEQNWHGAHRAMRKLMYAVATGNITPVSSDLITRLGDSYKNVVDYFSSHFYEPFIIRYGSNVFVFDSTNLPGPIEQLKFLTTVAQKPLQAEPEELEKFYLEYGVEINKIYRPAITFTFPIYINNQLYIFDQSWLIYDKLEVESYIVSFFEFNTKRGWSCK